jgi:DNA repair protein SbcD/Mre11
MKIIHTSDWHLGQKFLHNEREEEHQLALDWLLDLIQQEQADGLLVAGDIFDTGNPPNYARRLYYRFLRKLLRTSCRHIVITGGNHDSPAMLNAPSELLQALNVHVIGAAGQKAAREVIEWRSEAGELEAVIAAVPFLRDRDLRYSVAGETGIDRSERIRLGIQQHYKQLADYIQNNYQAEQIPIVAMGHLYATGARASAKQDNIYIGNIENIDAEQFPALYDYVALGHIHRAQIVGQQERVRYSGSLIPLSFSETQDDKSVYLLEFEGKALQSTQPLAVPTFRRLKTITGSLEEVKASLDRFAAKEREGLTPWVEVQVDLDRLVPQLSQLLQEHTTEMNLELLKIRARYPKRHQRHEEQAPDLDSLDTEEVFRMKCESYGSPPEDMDQLVDTFRELQTWRDEEWEE